MGLRMKLSKSYLSVLLVLFGCSNHSMKFEGYFTYGHETSVFRQCNETQYFWLNGEPKAMDIIDNASLQLAEKMGEPYQKIYVQFSGFFEHREPVGFEEETDGIIYMRELIENSENPPKHCQ